MAVITIYPDEETLARIERKAEGLDMEPEQYVQLALEVCDALPDYLLFSVAAGVPVNFYASAEVGCNHGE